MDKTKNTGLPVPAQRDTRMDDFWDNLDSSLVAAVPPPRNLDVGLSDVARAVGAGGLELVGGIGELARQAGNYGRQNGGKDQGDYLENARANLAKKLAPVLDVVAGAGELAQSGADSLKEGMSADAKEAMSRSLVSESPSGSIILGDGAGDIDVWAMKMAQGVGSLIPTLASGGITGLAAKATIGRMVTASMIKRGAAQEVAEAVAAKTVSRLATGAATTTGVTGSVGAAGVNARDSVLGMSFDELRNSTTFRDAFLRIDSDQQTAHLSDSEKLRMAREETANLASQATMGDAKTWGAAAVGTLMGDTMLFKMLAGKGTGGSMLKGMAKGAAGEGVSEALEEGTQQYSVNEALNEVAGADIDPMTGVASSAIEGGLIGMGVGGVTGGLGGLRGERNDAAVEGDQEQHPSQEEQDLVSPVEVAPEVVAESEAAPTVDQSPLGPSNSQFDEVRDVPAYLRQDDTADRFKGMAEDSEVQTALAEPRAPTVDELLAQAKNQPEVDTVAPAPMDETQTVTTGQPFAASERPVVEPAAVSEQSQLTIEPPSISPTDATIGPLKSLRITKRGKPFVSEKEALLASRKTETPVPLNGGGFGVAVVEEVEQVKASHPEQLEPAVDTGYREVIPGKQLRVGVSNDPATQATAISDGRQSDHLGTSQRTSVGPEPTSTGLTDRTGVGDPADLPAPDGPQKHDMTLTAPATDAGVAVSEPVAQEREEGGKVILLSKQAMAQGDKPTKHLTRVEANSVTKGWLKQYLGAAGIDVQIHATQAELEQALDLDAKDGLIRRAAFDRDTSILHIAADTISTPSHLRQILRHEVLAHYGLANVLGGGAYSSLIYRVRNSRNEPSMKSVWDWVETNYAGEDVGVQAEEVIAHLAELEPSAWRRGWDKVVSWVTQALRKAGFLPEGRVSAAEIRAILEAVGSHLRRNEGRSLSPEMGYRFSAERTPWREGFPEVILHGRLGDATAHPDYEAAKGGDDAAARRLVSEVLSPDAIKQIKTLIGGREAIALGVHAEEAVSRNAIPRAMADMLAKVLGLDVDLDIVQATKVGRTAQDGFGRLTNQPSFDGPVRTDKPYIIMDDTLTQGGTLANLKGYIETRGGEVLAATALTGKQYSAKIAIDRSTLEQLRDHYDGTGLEAWWHNRFDYGFDSLTESEARYLLRAKDADKIRDRVAAAGQSSPARSEHESARDDGSLSPDGLKFSQSFSDQANTLSETLRDHTKFEPGEAIRVVKNWVKQRRPLLLGALTDLQIDQVYRDITGGAVSEYQRLRTQMEADRNDILLDAETRIDPLWDALGKGEKAALSNLMHDATMARLHPDLSLKENSLYLEAQKRLAKAKKPETRSAIEEEIGVIEQNHAELSKQYQALNPKAKALYATMRETYISQWNSLHSAIEQRLEDLLGVSQGKAMAAEMRQKMEHALQHGPYFPLTRFGDYVVKANHGEEYIREHFERRIDAERAVKQYQRDGYNAVMTVKEEGAGASANAHQLGMEMLDFLERADGVSKSELKDEIWQAMLKMLPDASYAKHAIHRRRVKGASRDAHRAYLSSVYHYARHLSKIRYGYRMQGELDKLNEQIQAGVAGEPSTIKPEDLEIAQQVLNEMNKRHDLNMNPRGKSWAGMAGNAAFLYYIGPSVASAVVNMTQNFTVMLPQLGAKYGFAKAAGAMVQALVDYARHGRFKASSAEAWHSLTRSTTLPADERALLERLYRAGVLDLTQAHSVAAKADTDQQDIKPMGKYWRQAMRWAGATFHNAEVLNREVAALAAYRLLKEAEPHLDDKQYADRVTEMVYDGHGNYAASNRPRYMRNDIAKVLTQFKIYSQMMTYVIYSNAIKAMKGDRVALKTLAGVLATHWTMAGVMGLPAPLTAVAYALAAAVDDDDDRTGEASFRLALTNTLGPRAGELLAKGPMDSLTNLSIAGRTGLNELWWREPKDGTEGDDLAWHAVQQILGPVAGIGVNLARGVGQAFDGHVQRGMETMLPKSIRDVAKAYRQAMEGEQTIKGDLILDDVSAWNVAMQGLGFGSALLAKNYDAREYIKGKEKRIAGKRSQLLTDYYMARKSGNIDEVQEVLERIKMFNAIHHPAERITGKSLVLSFKSKSRSNERTQGGVYLNRNREYLREEGRFAQ